MYLKNYFCPDRAYHEIEIGRYVADACDGKTIYEIQTGSLYPLKAKIKYYIENTAYDIMIIHPIISENVLLWIDPQSGEAVGKPRRSSKHEGVFDMLSEMLYLKEYIDNERVRFCFPVMTLTEERILNGWSKDRKKGAEHSDKLPREILEVKLIETASDIKDEVLDSIPKKFTREELSHIAKIKGRKLWALQNLLLYLNVIKKSDSDGKKIIFEKII